MSSTTPLHPRTAFTTHIPIRSMLTNPNQERRKPPQTKREKIKLFKSTSIILIINHHEYHDFNDTQTRPLQHLTETIFAYLFMATTARRLRHVRVTTILTSPHLNLFDLVFFEHSPLAIASSIHSVCDVIRLSSCQRLSPAVCVSAPTKRHLDERTPDLDRAQGEPKSVYGRTAIFFFILVFILLIDLHMHGVPVSFSSDSVPVRAVERAESPTKEKGGVVVVEEERRGFLVYTFGAVEPYFFWRDGREGVKNGGIDGIRRGRRD
jgi:hypothetical protein